MNYSSYWKELNTMASEDNFLRLDVNNYDDEIKYHIDNGDLNREDLIDFLLENRISVRQFIDYVEYGGFNEE